MSDHMDDHDEDDFDIPPMMEDLTIKRIKKGEEINISRLDPGIRDITVGIGWDLKRFEGDPIDLDASIFLLDKNDKTITDEDFVFYNNLVARDGAVKHFGDSRTGAGDGDDEKITIDLMSLPFEVVRIAFALSIYDYDTAENNFEMVRNVYFRIVNNTTDHETFRFELDGDLGHTTGICIGYLDRIGSEWVYQAVGESVQGGLARMATDYGIMVTENLKS